MIILVNLNDFLGGGETLMVRMAGYLQKRDKPFCLICAKQSYIHSDLQKNEIPNIITLNNKKIDFYYQNDAERMTMLKEFTEKLPVADSYSFVTFCMRDLYTITQLSKEVENSKVSHLILHYQDNLYVCQSLFDKFVKKYFSRENYSRKKQIAFNNHLFNKLCDSNAIIPMSDLMVNLWNRKFGIRLSKDNVVALPTYDFSDEKPTIQKNNHKILFIGRIVDFKIPGLCVMLNYINTHKEYALTVIGNGNRNFVDRFIKKNNIDTSRINFIGLVNYSKLGDIIKQHSIGYAMGTSIIEICRYGLPVIMALSTPKHRLFKRNICGGLYANCVRGNVGDNLFAGESEDNQPLLEDVMRDLENNYEKSAEACYEYVKNEYNFTSNIEKYLEIIENSKPTDFSDFEIPKASKLRRYFFTKIKN